MGDEKKFFLGGGEGGQLTKVGFVLSRFHPQAVDLMTVMDGTAAENTKKWKKEGKWNKEDSVLTTWRGHSPAHNTTALPPTFLTNSLSHAVQFSYFYLNLVSIFSPTFSSPFFRT